MARYLFKTLLMRYIVESKTLEDLIQINGVMIDCLEEFDQKLLTSTYNQRKYEFIQQGEQLGVKMRAGILWPETN